MCLLLCGSARADVLVALERSGFFGQFALGVVYEAGVAHEFELAIGEYPNGTSDYAQFDGEYRYSQWLVTSSELDWRPVQVGLFAIDSQDATRFFSTSPARYPQSNYYDETSLRGGLVFGTSLEYRPWGVQLGYRFRLIDTGVVAVYNNAHRDLQYYISSGLSLSYRF